MTFCKSFTSTKSTSSEKKIPVGKSPARLCRTRTNVDFALRFTSNETEATPLSVLSPNPHHNHCKNQPGHQQNQNQQPADKQGRLPLLFRSRLGDPKEIDKSEGNEPQN